MRESNEEHGVGGVCGDEEVGRGVCGGVGHRQNHLQAKRLKKKPNP